MGIVLGGVQLPSQIRSLLDEVLSACVARSHITVQSLLCRFHLIDFGRLLGQLVTEVGDRFVALLDLCTRDFALMARIAQLFFKRDLGLCKRLGGGLPGNLGWVVDTNPISVEADGEEKKNPGGIEDPHLRPRYAIGERGKAMGMRRKIACAAEILGLMFFLVSQAFEESLLSFLLRPSRARFCTLRLFAGCNRGNRLADRRFVLPKGFRAGLANGKMLL
jgi:hypothetical protein